MTLSDLASIGSFVSGVAVLISLVYVGIQVRQSERNQRALVQQARAARLVDMHLRLSEPAMAELRNNGMSGDAIASEQELSRFRSLFTALTYSMEDTVLQHEFGLIEDAEFEAFRERMRRAFMSPAMRVLWKESRVFHGGKFRAFIDAVIRDARAPQTPAGASAEHSLVHWRAAIAAERAAASTLPDTNRPPPTLP